MPDPKARKTQLLFVCTANMQRSPTAEHIFFDSDTYEARSAGTSSLAPQPLSQELVDWADLVFVMESGHAEFIEHNFEVGDTPIVNLEIPDEYIYDHPALVALIKERTDPYLTGA